MLIVLPTAEVCRNQPIDGDRGTRCAASPARDRHRYASKAI
jgi:hypothetical protein